MIYNPIFEEELSRKNELHKLKKAIKNRARKTLIQNTINRVYGILKRRQTTSLLNKTEGELLIPEQA